MSTVLGEERQDKATQEWYACVLRVLFPCLRGGDPSYYYYKQIIQKGREDCYRSEWWEGFYRADSCNDDIEQEV